MMRKRKKDTNLCLQKKHAWCHREGGRGRGDGRLISTDENRNGSGLTFLLPLAMRLLLLLLLLLYFAASNSHRTLATVAVVAVAVRRMQLPCNIQRRYLRLLHLYIRWQKLLFWISIIIELKKPYIIRVKCNIRYMRYKSLFLVF